MKQRTIKILIVALSLMALGGLFGCFVPFQLLFYLAIGWALYLDRVAPKIQVSWSGVATAAVCLSLLAVGLHRFLRWLCAARPWPARWTAAILGVVVLMFVSGIAAVGITHQTAWLATSPEPILEESALREYARRIQAGNQMKELVRAMHDFAATNGSLPAHAAFGPDGQPLLSWRVLILPFVEEGELFQEFRLDEPWDSPHNLRLLPRMPRVFALPPRNSGIKDHATVYQVFVGPGAAFEGRKGLNMLVDFPDGLANTILIAEAATAVPWTKPADLPYSPDSPIPSLGALSPKHFLAAMADGGLRTVSKDQLTETTLRAAITRNGGEVLSPDWSD